MEFLIGQNSEISAIHGYSFEKMAYNLSLRRLGSLAPEAGRYAKRFSYGFQKNNF
jgi:hypothetical protein